MKAEVLVDETLSLGDGRYRAIVKVYKVTSSVKFPDGIKAKFVLIDVYKGVPRLVVDNHAPFGFHLHGELPSKKHKREPLQTTDYKEARELFLKEVRRIINEEDT